jgi:hypothetical protein
MVAPNRGWQKSVTLVNTTPAVLRAAEQRSKHYVSGLVMQNKHATVASVITVLAGAEELFKINLKPVGDPITVLFPRELNPAGLNTAITVVAATTGSDIIVNAFGFSGA